MAGQQAAEARIHRFAQPLVVDRGRKRHIATGQALGDRHDVGPRRRHAGARARYRSGRRRTSPRRRSTARRGGRRFRARAWRSRAVAGDAAAGGAHDRLEDEGGDLVRTEGAGFPSPTRRRRRRRRLRGRRPPADGRCWRARSGLAGAKAPSKAARRSRSPRSIAPPAYSRAREPFAGDESATLRLSPGDALILQRILRQDSIASEPLEQKVMCFSPPPQDSAIIAVNSSRGSLLKV